MPVDRQLKRDEFLALPAAERDRLIAEQLGWQEVAHGPSHERLKGWFVPNGQIHDKLPPFSTSDGVAFEHLFPAILKLNQNLMLANGDSWVPYNCAVMDISSADGHVVEMEPLAQADTWALALALALLTLKGIIGGGTDGS